MKAVPMSWRPISSADLEKIQAAVSQAVDTWHQEWFVQACAADVRVGVIDNMAKFSPPARGEQWSLGAHARLVTTPDAWTSLLYAALDLTPGTTMRMTDTLEDLLNPVRDELQNDLLKRLGERLQLGAPMPLLRAHPAAHAAREKVLLTCRLSDAKVLFHMRFTAPWRWQKAETRRQPAKADVSLVKRNESLADTRLKVMALLGRCELSVSELAGLAPGDVITTRQPLSAPLDLALLADTGTPGQIFAVGRPGLSLGKTSLQITSIKDVSP